MRYEVEYDLHQRGGALRRTVEAESAEEAVAEVRRVQPGIPELPFRLVRVTEIEDKE